MTALQVFNAFRTFGADVLLLALGVTLLTSLLKKTVMKNCNRRVFVFLPFAIGLVVYAVFAALVSLSADPFTKDLLNTVEKGFSCGLAATLYYVVYEQFIRSPKSTEKQDPLYTLLDGIVPDGKKDEAAAALTEKSTGVESEQLPEVIRETLLPYASPELSEAETGAAVIILTQYFIHRNA
ncbi:MAG: hypothetical protein K2L02_04505 [Clostridia bacterium]|nr:hypothetical protein [Clostridia bacterium]